MKKSTLKLFLTLLITLAMVATVSAYTNPGAVESPDEFIVTPLVYMYEDAEFIYFTTIQDLRAFHKSDFKQTGNWEINCIAEPKEEALRQKSIAAMRNVDPGLWQVDEFWGTVTKMSYNEKANTLTFLDMGYYSESGHLLFMSKWNASKQKIYSVKDNQAASEICKEISIFLKKETTNPTNVQYDR